MLSIECVVRSGNLLGENPVWNVSEQALFWLDTRTPIIRRYQPSTGAVDEWLVPEPYRTTDQIVSFAFRRQSGMIAAFRRGFCFLDIRSGLVEPVVQAERVPEVPETNRMNDAKCDARGRYWCGSMDTRFVAPTGSLYRLDRDLHCAKLDTGVICSNGIAFSPDYRTMFYADSRAAVIWAYDFDLDAGVPYRRRVFTSTERFSGRPDGATVDTDGNYWIAMVAMGAVAKFNPRGGLERLIELPVSFPTMCAFGGSRLDTLFVTSGSFPLSAEQKEREPLAGALFAIEGTGSQGIAEPMFAA